MDGWLRRVTRASTLSLPENKGKQELKRSLLTCVSTTFLTHALVSAAYLPILNLVPEAVQQKDKAKEFFDAAVVIFRASYVTGVFVEDALLSYFSDWSGLLLSLCGQPRPQLCVSASPWLVTDGDECVSRDMVHEGLLGLTKLLKTCVWCLDLKTSPKSWFHFLESSQEARYESPALCNLFGPLMFVELL